jgi:microcystin-dependent protein
MGGAESVTLSTAQLPSHTHKLLASNSTGNTNNPSGASLASNSNTFTSSTANAVLSSSMVGSSGSSQPVAIMPPYLAMNWCICLYGIYPSRS